MKIYLVGGAVRDKLLGLTPTERDWVVVGSSPQEMLAMGFKQVGKDFPVFLHPDTKEEYALARMERSTGRRYQDFKFNFDSKVTLEEDLIRRDLTINAIAEDEAGNLIDPCHGVQDLRDGKLRAVSSAFAEDPVRVLRLAKFAARFLNFHVTQDTQKLLQEMVTAGELDYLVPERIWQETKNALKSDYPHRFVEVLRACGALKVVFPELDRLFGVPQPLKHHPEKDVGVHTLMVLQQAVRLSPKGTIRFAALVHDLGKGTTKKEMLPKHHGHEARSVNLVKKLCARLKVPKKYTQLAVLVAQYHGHFHRVADELRPDTIIKVLQALDAFRREERFEDFLLACEADQRGRPGYEDKIFPQADFFRKVYAKASEVEVKDVIASGFSGSVIKQELSKRRASAIKQMCQG